MLASGRDGAGKVRPKRHEFPGQAGGRSIRKEVPVSGNQKTKTSQNSPTDSQRWESPELTIMDRFHHPS